MAGQPLKGRLIAQFTVSLKRYPDTKSPRKQSLLKGCSGARMGRIRYHRDILGSICIQIKL